MSLTLVVVIVVAMFSACGTSSKKDTSASTKAPETTEAKPDESAKKEIAGEISMFMWQPDAPQIPEEWANTFMEKYPKVKIDLQMMTGQGLIENIQPRVAANNLPDVVSTNVSELISDLADKGMFADVADTKAWNEQIDGMKTAWTSPSGVKFGISGGIASSLIYYNKDLFDKAEIKNLPKNWDELLETCEKLKSVDITPFAWFRRGMKLVRI
jgi:multiple sugar transport system substrate-binding protein